mmetsp:Transcript_7475/g.9239  ORF Transcript_7475/g.9239 Transcript_7475/m.9239 type:complete len:93 (+) Transcript_7475:607-885(+)
MFSIMFNSSPSRISSLMVAAKAVYSSKEFIAMKSKAKGECNGFTFPANFCVGQEFIGNSEMNRVVRVFFCFPKVIGHRTCPHRWQCRTFSKK